MLDSTGSAPASVVFSRSDLGTVVDSVGLLSRTYYFGLGHFFDLRLNFSEYFLVRLFFGRFTIAYLLICSG